MKKRNLLKASTLIGASVLPEEWIKPVVHSMLLPAHATITQCNDTDILGSWSLHVNNYEGISNHVIILQPGGRIGGTRFVDEWSFDGETIIMQQDVSDWIFTGKLNSSCSSMEGTYVSKDYGFEPPKIREGTWYAARNY